MDGRFQVLFHSPVRGASHLSLTVLVRYRSSGRIQPCGMVPADSDRVPRAPPYSGTLAAPLPLRVRECHPLRRAFPRASTSARSAYREGPTTPRRPRAPRFGLIPFRSPLLGESMFLSFPAGTEMFQFPALAPVYPPVTGSIPPGCPIRTRADQFVYADPRALSRLAASFLAAGSQGILRPPSFPSTL